MKVHEEMTRRRAGDPLASWNAVIDLGPIVDAISGVTASLRGFQLPPEAAPAFLLDSARLSGTRSVQKGMFDNRWMIFRHDFPSATL